jgi:PAS domain S-box-containing protein
MDRTHVALRERITLLSWTLPLAFFILVVLYQLIPARWIHDTYGDPVHFAVEILFYGTVGPLLTFWVLRLIGRWLDEKEQAELQARASERRLAAITNASADAILSIDASGQIESWNRGAEFLFGYAAEEVQGQPFARLFGSDEAAELESRWLAETVRQNGFVRGYEASCLGSDGRPIIVELTATHLDGNGRGTHSKGAPLSGISLILRDITLRKQREEEIRRLNASLNQQVAERTRELAEKVEELAEANAALQNVDQTRSEFMSVVSHQLRAPLTNMRGAVERMRADCQNVNPTCIRMFGIVAHQTGRLERLVQDVLNAARIEAGDLVFDPEPMSMLPTVQQVVDQMHARTTGRSIRVPVKPGLPLAFADRDRVAEVLANLLDNADKYSPADRPIVVDVAADQTEVTVSVRDYGSGIATEELDRVFGKFYRTDGSDSQAAYGYGLGLYVCRRLVEEQDGRIWAENHPQGGTVFAFALPIWQGDDGNRNDLGD